MIKKRYHFLIIAVVLLTGIIIGSFLDYQISSSIFDRYNTFGLAVSSFGMIPGYGFLPFLGGISLALLLNNKNWPVWKKLLMVALTIAFYCLGVYGIGKDIFNINGFYNPTLQKFYVGYIYTAFLMIPVYVVGYVLGKKVKNQKMWLVLVIIAAAIFLTIVPGVALFKTIMRRPRYRVVVYYHLIDNAFHQWWEPFASGYKQLKAEFTTNPVFIQYGVDSEEFKSFPSGHSAAAMIAPMFLSFLPYVEKRLMKYQTYLLYAGFGWALIVMFARILVGAHYLTDTCFAALLMLVFFYIANEIILRNHLLEENKEEH